VLRLRGDPVDHLFDAVLPEEVKILPDDLAVLDALLDDPALLDTVATHWRRLQAQGDQDLVGRGRPTIAMDSYLRMMVVKHRGGYGYETLVAAVSDSIHLRRFCRIPLGAQVPDESTVRKLTRRLGPDVADDLVRAVVKQAVSDKVLRPRAIRIDSTAADADIRYPTDAGLAQDAVRLLARVGRQVAKAVPVAGAAQRVRDRSRAVGLRLRALTRTLRRRSGEAKADVQRLTEEAAACVRTSVREAERLLVAARRSRSVGAGVSRRGRAKAMARLEEVIGLARRIGEQVKLRFAGKKIDNRLVSLFDVDARPIRRGKLAKPNEFGYVVQYAEVTANTKPGARGLIVPPKLEAGSTPENALLPESAAELEVLGIEVVEGSFDAGFHRGETEAALPGVVAHIVGSHDNAGSRRTRRRRANFRVGAEGRISHLKRSYGAGRPRLKGKVGARIWAGWSTLAYDLDTVVLLLRRSEERRRARKEAASA
jgi:IS5 family transposase